MLWFPRAIPSDGGAFRVLPLPYPANRGGRRAGLHGGEPLRPPWILLAAWAASEAFLRVAFFVFSASFKPSTRLGKECTRSFSLNIGKEYLNLAISLLPVQSAKPADFFAGTKSKFAHDFKYSFESISLRAFIYPFIENDDEIIQIVFNDIMKEPRSRYFPVSSYSVHIKKDVIYNRG